MPDELRDPTEYDNARTGSNAARKRTISLGK